MASTNRSVLLRGGRVVTPVSAEATALLVVGARVAWVGADADADADSADETVELDGAVVAPAFVDAHVHATSTGLALTGLDLAGARSLADALDMVAAHAARESEVVVLGTGWDETRWPERRPPTADELDGASGGRGVYLSRVDVHSAVASTSLLSSLPDLPGLDGYRADGWLRREAHHQARRAAFARLTPDQRQAAQRATRARAAECGIGCFHELAGPEISSEEDCSLLLELAREEPGPAVVPYWGELGGVATAKRLGAPGAAGDLFIDGAIGSRTARLCEDYADDPGNRGSLYHDVDAVARHVVDCTLAGVQAGFHVIGDDACETVLDGMRVAVETVGADRLCATRHRLEHVEMISDVERLAEFGLVASVQPAFDAFWGGRSGMYAARLGPERAVGLNPFAAMAAAGVRLAFGSDAPVTPLAPWAAVKAATGPTNPAHAVDMSTAFEAHTRGGWEAACIDGEGTITPGSRAVLAVWDTWPDGDMADAAAPEPVCLRTIVDGRSVFVR